MNDTRLLPADEIPLLLPLARTFYAEGRLLGKLKELHFVATLQAQVASGAGFVLASGVPIRGTIGGVMFNDMATADRCCMEFFWYVQAAERGSLGLRLLAAWEREAMQRGATRLLMAHLHAPNTDSFSRLYERRGYQMKEQIFMKEVTP